MSGGRTAAVAFITALAAAVLTLTACGGSGSVRSFPQPETAAQVARQIGADGFTDHGSAPPGGVQDDGTAIYHGRKIGIDTFADTTARNSWLQSAASLGVSPLLEGATWVAYWSTDTAAPVTPPS
jgi:hypothetical protein